MSGYETVVGLEVHAQLATRTKLFCGCANEFGAAPNTHVCPVCTGQPGALPVVNGEAVRLGVRAALALGADVAHTSKFDRKNYFYPDLPKGYQVSQYDEPYCSGGGLPLSTGTFVRLERIHLEEDAGKAIHDRGDATLVDLNRAGVPLIESVTQPDMRSADEAVEYLQALRGIVRWLGVSDGDMEKGSLRCDVNISVRRPGEPLGTKVELKNLNSFRHVHAAIEHETARQIAALEAGERLRQETRLFDDVRGETRPMRSKEDAPDYRYFPDPDLPPLVIEGATIEAERAALPELPAARRVRYADELGLSAYDAGVLTEAREVSDLFEEVATRCGDAKEAANRVTNDVLRALADDGIAAGSVAELPIGASEIADLIGLVARGAVSKTAARAVLAEMLAHGGGAEATVERLGLALVRDDAAVEGWCRDALAANSVAADDVRAGNAKALGALIGPVMAASRGQADPAQVREVLLRLIERSG